MHSSTKYRFLRTPENPCSKKTPKSTATKKVEARWHKTERMLQQLTLQYEALERDSVEKPALDPAHSIDSIDSLCRDRTINADNIPELKILLQSLTTKTLVWSRLQTPLVVIWTLPKLKSPIYAGNWHMPSICRQLRACHNLQTISTCYPNHHPKMLFFKQSTPLFQRRCRTVFSHLL